MKKFTKRFLSALSALAMACSCMVIANTGTVFAAAKDDWSVKASDFYSGKKATSDTTEQASAWTVTASDNLSKLTLSYNVNFFRAFGAACPEGAEIVNDTGKSWNYELQLKGTRTITVTPAADGIITVYWYDTGSRDVTIGSNAAVDADNFTVTSSSSTCKAGEDLLITAEVGVCLLEISYEYSKLTDYTWTLDDSDLTLSLDGELSLENTKTTQLTNILNYSGTDYFLDSYTNLTEDDIEVKNSYVTVKPQDSWFTLARQDITDRAFLNVSDLEEGIYSSGDVLGEYFEMYCSYKGTAATDAPKFTEYGDIEYSKRFCFQGALRDIMFTTTGPALVQIVFATIGNEISGSCIISETADSYEADDIIAEAESTKSAEPIVMTVPLTEAGTYYIYGSNGSNITLYSINVVVDAELVTSSNEEDEEAKAGNGIIAAYVNDSDAYVLAAVGEDELELGEKLRIISKGIVIKTTDTVYSYVSADNFIFTASDIVSDMESDKTMYIVGIKYVGSLKDAVSNIMNMIGVIS